jgi:hypothetical protein
MPASDHALFAKRLNKSGEGDEDPTIIEPIGGERRASFKEPGGRMN